ncbi:hypothetical protein PF005_g16195 [Phytophthora fragariae]|uniref:Uncharacterized protein n=1 Tax=Phytophthora fragariae TaxID=53985 RepID=A0A6A3R7Y2_9STRA|nr:hypothetical protein PF009_g20851 [Phytophthora fragariae]KAE9071973.1 hypothetical protein PF010_g25666 [Phytophthora fragariae]KAE9088750.1 hypothetical protein PF007_g19858 [Phytophthora fragariae]KAE9095219.1 hypothetical protein PF006_g24074 [Phytophthora fragariae]KAE9198282.1 hypothetical protein PF005_g16195 [Phytophthora fragariae]
MSERKRQRLDEDARRLDLCAADLRELSAAIGTCAFRAPSDHVSVPLQRSCAASKTPRPAAGRPASRSLYSVVSSSAYAAKTYAQSRQETWAEALQRLAAELDAPRAQKEAAGRCERLRRRFEALSDAVRLCQDKLRRAGDELALQDRVESQLAHEEAAWEQQMQTREQRVAEREVELQALREERAADEAGSADAEQEQEHEQEDAGDDTEEEEEEQAAEQELRVERAELREVLALRAEEKRDIQAAIESLQRKRVRRSAALAEQRKQQQQEETENVEADAAVAARQRVLAELRDEKEALQRDIIAAEELEEKLEENVRDLPALKDKLQRAKAERAQVQTQLDSLRLELARRKRKMRHMVDVQLLTARDTNPPTLREEAVLLHLLYEHEGEMGVNELKQEASAVLKEHGKPNGNGVVIRALYSLVANGLVQIDRSYGNGLVTSLLV